MSSDIDLAAIRARIAAAPPGPWVGDRLDGSVKYEVLDADGYTIIRGCNGNHDPSYGVVSEHPDRDGAEELILGAPADLSALCDEVERLRLAHGELRAAVREFLRVDTALDNERWSKALDRLADLTEVARVE